ncbi:MAG: hypothetical protein ACREA4_12260 [Nitrososphaera sp.]
MLAYQIFQVMFAVSIPVVALIVVGRHFIALIRSLRIKRFGFAFLALFAIVFLTGMVAGVGAVWFAYGVAHTKKELSDDLLLVLITGLPFYGTAYGLWRFAGQLQKRKRSLVA